jgi:hypothetical protein
MKRFAGGVEFRMRHQFLREFVGSSSRSYCEAAGKKAKRALPDAGGVRINRQATSS